jgi:hypothetical protein
VCHRLDQISFGNMTHRRGFLPALIEDVHSIEDYLQKLPGVQTAEDGLLMDSYYGVLQRYLDILKNVRKKCVPTSDSISLGSMILTYTSEILSKMSQVSWDLSMMPSPLCLPKEMNLRKLHGINF